MSQDVRPLHVNIPLELKQRFDKMPWGIRTHVVQKLLEMACDLYEQHGELGMGAILAGNFRLKSDGIVEPPQYDTTSRKGISRG